MISRKTVTTVTAFALVLGATAVLAGCPEDKKAVTGGAASAVVPAASAAPAAGSAKAGSSGSGW